jgi:hypothetical protein
LINPCDDDPSNHFTFPFDPETKLASVYGKTRRGTTTERILGLNRPELRAHRSKQIEKMVALARFARTDPAAKVLLEEAKQGSAEYAAFVRSLPL